MKTAKYFFIVGVIIIMVVLPLCSQEQMVKGTIRSDVTGDPISGAVVSIENSSIKTISAVDGSFSLLIPQQNTKTLIARCLGYQTEKRVMKESIAEPIIIRLKEVVLPTQGVVITASKASERNSPIAFSGLEPREIEERYTVQDIPVLLSELPSTTFYSESGNGIGYTYLNIRGFDQRRISVMVNGVPQNDPEDHNVYWLDFSDLTSDLGDIQVQRGAGNLMSGAPTIGGSVNLVTTNFTRQQGITLFAGLGSFNTKKFSIGLNSGLLEGTYAMSARLSKISSDGYRNNSWVDFNSYFLSAARFDENSSLQLILYGGPVADHLAYFGIPEKNLQDRTKRKENPIRRPEEIENFSQPCYQFLHEWKIDDKTSLSNTIYYFTGEGFFNYDGSWAPYSYYRITPQNGFSVNGDPDTLFIPNALIHAYNKNYQYGWLPRAVHKHDGGMLIVGGDIRIHRSVHTGSLEWGEQIPAGVTPDYNYYYYRGSKDMFALFAHELFQVTSEISVMADIQLAANRYRLFDESYIETDFSQQYFFINPKIGINANLSENLNIYTTLSRTSREPRLKNLYDAAEASTPVSWGTPVVPQFQIDPSGRYDFSKPLVKPETMNAVEIGAALMDEKVKISMNTYLMIFDDEIVKSGRLDRFGQPVTGNAERTQHLGIELSASAFLPQGFEVRGNATVSQNTFLRHTEYSSSGPILLDGKQIAGFPGLLGNLRLTYRIDDGTVSFALRHVGKFFTTNYQENHRTVDPYTIGDLSFSYTLKDIGGIRSAGIHVQINNIFDELYAANGEKDEFFPAATRNFFAGMTIEL